MMASHDIAMNLDVKVPMRDGVRLPADLYLPRGAPPAPAATSSVSNRELRTRAPDRVPRPAPPVAPAPAGNPAPAVELRRTPSGHTW